MNYKEVIVGVVGAVVGAAAALGGSYASYLSKDKELDITMTRVGLCLMASTSFLYKGEEEAGQFATALLKKHSGVDLETPKAWLVDTGAKAFLSTPICHFEPK